MGFRLTCHYSTLGYLLHLWTCAVNRSERDLLRPEWVVILRYYIQVDHCSMLTPASKFANSNLWYSDAIDIRESDVNNLANSTFLLGFDSTSLEAHRFERLSKRLCISSVTTKAGCAAAYLIRLYGRLDHSYGACFARSAAARRDS